MTEHSRYVELLVSVPVQLAEDDLQAVLIMFADALGGVEGRSCDDMLTIIVESFRLVEDAAGTTISLLRPATPDDYVERLTQILERLRDAGRPLNEVSRPLYLH